MQKRTDLRVNAVSIELKEDEKEKTFHFWKEKDGFRIPLRSDNFPSSFVARYPKMAEEQDYLFGEPESISDKGSAVTKNEPYAITLKMDEAFDFTKHYLHYIISKLLKSHADIISRNFVRTPEFWFRYPQKDDADLIAYRKFRLKVVKRWYTKGLGLSIVYSGVSYCYPHAVISDDEKVLTTDLSRVIYNGYLFHYNDIPEDKRGEIDFSEMYPVVNYAIRKKLGVFPKPDPAKNRFIEYRDQINWFLNEKLGKSEVRDQLPFKLTDGKWAEIPEESYYDVGHKAAVLQFRKGEKDINPYMGMKKYGPRMPAPDNHYRFIYIAANGDIKGVGKKLHNYLKGKEKGIPALFRFANITGDFSGGFIGFENEENPMPEIIAGLNRLEKRPGVKDFAFYITPFESDERDPNKRRIYYRVKEELLKRDIVSQVVERPTIEYSDFRYVMPNLAVATLAKLGGIPWQLAQPPDGDLIVGVGAFKPREFSERYLGSAFCFRSNGTFKGLRCFTQNEPRMLAGSIREAVREYVAEQGDVERLVIHFYKSMSYKERKPILEMLQTLGLDIPVFVLTINKTEYEETLLFDEAHAQLIPINGTYFYQRRGDVLLCNNTRHNPSDFIKRGFHFPVRIKFWASDDDLLKDYRTRRMLVRQVYQFSRLYWKSVSQQSVPVTIRYPEMVAEMFPWFEGLTLPSFGRKNLWFL